MTSLAERAAQIVARLDILAASTSAGPSLPADVRTLIEDLFAANEYLLIERDAAAAEHDEWIGRYEEVRIAKERAEADADRLAERVGKRGFDQNDLVLRLHDEAVAQR